MKELTSEERVVLQSLARGDEWLPEPCASDPELPESMVPRGLVRIVEDTDEHVDFDITPLGRIALRLPVSR